MQQVFHTAEISTSPVLQLKCHTFVMEWNNYANVINIGIPNKPDILLHISWRFNTDIARMNQAKSMYGTEQQ